MTKKLIIVPQDVKEKVIEDYLNGRYKNSTDIAAYLNTQGYETTGRNVQRWTEFTLARDELRNKEIEAAKDELSDDLLRIVKTIKRQLNFYSEQSDNIRKKATKSTNGIITKELIEQAEKMEKFADKHFEHYKTLLKTLNVHNPNILQDDDNESDSYEAIFEKLKGMK